jgi:hypothetical protein
MSGARRARLGLELRIIGIVALVTALAAPVAGALLVISLYVTGASAHDLDRAGGGVLEALCPLGVALAASSVVGRDPGAELVMTTPASYRRILFLRVGLIAGLGAVVTLVDAVVCYAIAAWPPHQGAAGLILLWAPPMIWLTALALLVAVAVRSPAAAAGLTGGLWLAQLVLAHDMQAYTLLRAQYLFITVASPIRGSDWTINRIALPAVGALAIAAVGLLLRRPQRFLAGDAS